MKAEIYNAKYDVVGANIKAAEPGQTAAENREKTNKKVDGPQSKDAGKDQRKGRKKPTHGQESENDAGKTQESTSDLQQQQQSPEQQQQPQGQYFYVPNQQGQYTLMKMLSPQNNQTGGANQTQTGSAGSTDDSKCRVLTYAFSPHFHIFFLFFL